MVVLHHNHLKRAGPTPAFLVVKTIAIPCVGLANKCCALYGATTSSFARATLKVSQEVNYEFRCSEP